MFSSEKIIIYVDMDQTLADYNSAYNEQRKKNPHLAYPQSTPGFFTALAPLSDAITTFHWLMSQELFETFILTAPSVKNPHCYSEKRLWTEKYLGFEAASRLIITPHKGLNKGHYLIDDQATGKGQELFEGNLIHFGSPSFPNWKSVKDYLIKHHLSSK